jgi:predicted O-methyltransferase YrrM
VENLPQAVLEVFQTRRVFAPDGQAQALESNVSQAEALQLYTAVRQLRPEYSVEIGLAHGISALAILSAISANGTGHHYVIDPFQANYGYCGEAMIQRAGYRDLHSLLEGFPEEVLPKLPGLEFALIDSSHLFDLTILEFVLIDKKLKAGGILALHDTWMPSIQAVLRFILANRAYEIRRDFSSEVAAELSMRVRWKQIAARWLGRMPGAERLLSTSVLRPWSTFEVGNLVFLRKLSNDQRDWRFHQRF